MRLSVLTYVLSGLLLLPLVLLAGCGGRSVEEPLTDAQESKLGNDLLRIIEEDPSATTEAQIGTDAEGQPVYPVFIHVSDSAAFREQDVPVNSWSGAIATARLTTAQIRRAARIEVVERIQLSGRAGLHDGG